MTSEMMRESLAGAAARGELRLFWQPKVELRDGRVTGAEALVRWVHPSFGLLRAAQFVPAAEASGEIVSLGTWVFQEACRAVARLRQRGVLPEPFAICVNFSPRQLADPALLDRTVEVLAETQTRGDDVILELTEDSFVESEAALPTLHALRETGIRFAIDDFGTGYSSLAYLNRLPVDLLKIDQSFIAEIDRGPGRHSMVKAILALAAALGMETVAEGVERTTQLAMLRQLGCRYGQGHLLGATMPEDELAAALATWSA